MTVKVEGLEKNIRTLEALPDDLQKASFFAIQDELALVEKIVKPRVPFRKGDLMNSWFTRESRNGGGHEQTGGFSKNYAWIQHEGDFNHPIRGESHFLTKTIRETDADRANRIATRTNIHSKILKS